MRLRLILGDTAVRRPRTRRSAKIKMSSAVRPYNIICRISFLCHSLTGDIVWMSITTPHETYPFETHKCVFGWASSLVRTVGHCGTPGGERTSRHDGRDRCRRDRGTVGELGSRDQHLPSSPAASPDRASPPRLGRAHDLLTTCGALHGLGRT